jgi:HEAT repeat protein
MLAPSDAKGRRVRRLLARLAILALAIATTSSCGQIRDKSTAELIAIVQTGEYDAVRGKGPACDAAYNLGLRKATEAVDALIAGLSTPAVDCMADALGLVGDVRAVEPLLGAFDAVSTNDLFKEDKASFDTADEALVAIGAPAVDPLLTIAATGDERTRDQVTYVLGRIRDPRAEAFLVDGLKTPNATADTTGPLAADALARIFGDQVDRLLPLLQSKETVAIAYGLVGLGHSGSEEALSDALMRFGDLSMASFYLNSGNPTLRSAALEWASANGYQLALPTGIPGGTVAPPAWGGLGAGPS